MGEQLHIELTADHRALMGSTIPQALDWAARRWAERRALSFVATPDVLTYAQLRDEVDRVRTGLELLGVAPGDRVGIMIPNQLEFPLAWLAVIDACAVAVPLNPKYTRRETEFVLDDVDAKWLVATGELLQTQQLHGVAGLPPDNVIVVGEAPGHGTSFSELRTTVPQRRRRQADPLDLVSIQFTSGTTGTPKGCMLTHAYWVDNGVWGAAAFDKPQHFLGDPPFYYMQNQAYLFSCLAGGGELHVTPGLSRRKFMGWLVDHQIDFAWLDAGMLAYPPSPVDRQLRLKKAPIDEFPPALHRELEQRFGLQARELYASTEAGNITMVPWDRDDLVGSGSIGVVFPNRETKIVDAHLDEVPAGQSGELLVRGPSMMLGYWNRPQTNAELMLPDGWFRTGDVVRKDADGQHYYIGRLRDVVRRSGENIAAVEVEQQIAAMPGVAETAVIPVPDPDRGEEGKVLIVPSPGAKLSAEDVVAWAAERLAPFKVPRYVEFRDTLPQLGNGKIAKAQLKAEPPFGDGVIDTMTARPHPRHELKPHA